MKLLDKVKRWKSHISQSKKIRHAVYSARARENLLLRQLANQAEEAAEFNELQAQAHIQSAKRSYQDQQYDQAKSDLGRANDSYEVAEDLRRKSDSMKR
jgi:hypothetical protein